MKPEVRHPLAEEYLARFRRAAARLPRSQRDELVAELTAHIEAGTLEAHTDADIRNMLDSLGDPDDIVTAAMPATREEPGPTGRMALGLGVAALVATLLGLIAAGIPLGVAAVITGVRARRHLRRIEGATGLATFGVVLGIVAAALPIVVMTVLVSVRTDSQDEPATTTDTTVTVPTPTTILPG